MLKSLFCNKLLKQFDIQMNVLPLSSEHFKLQWKFYTQKTQFFLSFDEEALIKQMLWQLHILRWLVNPP